MAEMRDDRDGGSLTGALLAALSVQEEIGATALMDEAPRVRKTAEEIKREKQAEAQTTEGARQALTATRERSGGEKVATGKPSAKNFVAKNSLANSGARGAKKPTAVAELAEAQALADKAQSLPELWQAIDSFTGCSLRAGANRTVIWRGSEKARLVLIGEGPGADEDAQGKPFVGRAGKLLDGLLYWAGFDESQVFISNIVFWRPPKNRAPEPSEVAVCLPFVAKQLALLRPEVVLLLGNTPMKALLPRLGASGITRARGQWTRFSAEAGSNAVLSALTMPVYGSFHPAYLLRSPQQTRFAWADLLAVAEKYEEVTGEKLNLRP